MMTPCSFSDMTVYAFKKIMILQWHFCKKKHANKKNVFSTLSKNKSKTKQTKIRANKIMRKFSSCIFISIIISPKKYLKAKMCTIILYI